MPRMGNTGYSGLPTASLFTARDGRQISLGVVQPNQFAALARLLGREDWLADPRFATPEARRLNFDAMTDELAAVIADCDAGDWEARMSAQGIPCGVVRRVDEATELARASSLMEIELANAGGESSTTRIPGAGFRMEPGFAVGDLTPALLDANRAEILAWLGLDEPAEATR